MNAKVADFDQIMVFMTTAEPPTFAMGDGKLQTWWLENGQIAPQVQAQAA